jgi:hypothetical protein
MIIKFMKLIIIPVVKEIFDKYQKIFKHKMQNETDSNEIVLLKYSYCISVVL